MKKQMIKKILLIIFVCSHSLMVASRPERKAEKKAAKKAERREHAILKTTLNQLNNVHHGLDTAKIALLEKINQLNPSPVEMAAIEAELLPKRKYSSTFFTDYYESTEAAARDQVYSLIEQTGASTFEETVDPKKSSAVQMMQTILHCTLAELKKGIGVYKPTSLKWNAPLTKCAVLTIDTTVFTDCYKAFLKLHPSTDAEQSHAQAKIEFKDSLHTLLMFANGQTLALSQFTNIFNPPIDPAGKAFTEIHDAVTATIQKIPNPLIDDLAEPTSEEIETLYSMIKCHNNPEECLLNILFGKTLQVLTTWGRDTAKFTKCFAALNQHRQQVEAKNRKLDYNHI